jgi:protein involved in polysaccharide export with SLBB domain
MFTLNYKSFLALVFLVSFTFQLNAQVNFGKTKSSDYSDQEIIQLIKKAENAGLGEAQVIEIARAQGVLDSELEIFKERVNSLKKSVNVLPEKAVSTAIPTIRTSSQDSEPKVPAPVAETPSIAGSSAWDISKMFDEKRFPAFANGRTFKAPDQYIIGVGDEISVTVFGNSYFNKVSRVDDRGRIDLGTALGKVYVKGLPFSKLDKVIAAAVGQKINLNGNELEVDLSFSRQISVNVTGEIQKPGTYQLPAANTVFNLLVLSGGPTNLGSVRNIHVVRGGKSIYTFDLYEFLLNPENNLFLEDGDFIVVKPIQKTVTLRGGVQRPGKLELLNGEGFNDAVKFSGGYSAKADPSRVTTSRLDGKERTLIQSDFSKSTSPEKMELKDGDEVFIFEQSDELQNKVEVSGEVYFPGTYALKSAMSVKNLLELAGGLTNQSNHEMAFVLRTLTDSSVEYLRLPLTGVGVANFMLQNNDQLIIFAQSRFVDAFHVEVRGEVRNPVKIDYKKGLTLGVLLDFAGGLKYSADAAEVEILRSSVFKTDFKPGDINKTESLKIQINAANSGGFSEFPLMAEDIVIVRRVSNLNDRIGVSIEGEVAHPGVFVMAKNENRVRDLIEKGGGLTEFAYPEAAQLYRKNGQQLAFNLKSMMKTKNSEYNYRLEEGDRLIVPLKQDLVLLPNTDTLLGQDKILAPHITGKRASFYMSNYSLGFNKEFKKKLLYVVEPGGSIKRTRNYGLFAITPMVAAGSEIHFQPVPKKEPKSDNGNDKKTDWNRVIENFTVKLTGIATLWVLLSRI